MWNLKRYKKICKYSEKVQYKNQNILTVCNSYLHIIRAHPFFLTKYENIFNNKSFIFYIFIFIKNIFELLIKFFIQFFYFEGFIPKKKNYKILALAHMINFNSFVKNIDYQYGNFFKKKTKGIYYFYLNGSKNKYDKFRFKKNYKKNNNYYLSNSKVSTYNFFKYLLIIFKEFFILFGQFLNKNNTNNEERIFLLNTALNVVSQSTMQNLIFYNKFKYFLEVNSVKKIITTFEGHPFEKLIFKIGSEMSIPVDAYQHSLISASQHSMFFYPNKDFRPKRILACGKNTFTILKKFFYPEIDVKLIGSTKYKKYSLKSKSYNSLRCLVVPEGFYKETIQMVSFCLDYIKKFDNINFVIRLHPEINKEKLFKINPQLKLHNSNLEISDRKDIIDDAKNCNLLLYRGTTFAADALGLNLKPFYLKNIDEIEIDSLWMFKNKFKEKIKNIEELNKSALKIKKKKNNKNELKKAALFSKSFYGKFDYKIKI